ncbi:adenine deaminase [Fodinicurvata sp. EGI_FJ10296]|uniref:adenine deaminase n=1 Tax=Fodinicurvata sp. EGI_FJ10296 TaxID=3231908 RepID=UPI0034541E68
MDKESLKRVVRVARGYEPADLVIRNTRFLDVISGDLVEGDIAVVEDRIVGTCDQYKGRRELDGRDLIAVPGFIDTHVHCESSLVTPMEFDRCILQRGTTTAICDPHEIANVLGIEGIDYFLEAARHTLMDLRVQLSSCVPATAFETAGAELDAAALVSRRGHDKALGLAEFMNFPGLLNGDDGVMEKLAAFQDGHIDGHSPLLRGKDLNAYLACGVRTCHETTGIDEAREKLRKGMHVLIRDGSVSKDVHALAPLISADTSPLLGFCTDDRNPLDIAEEGHIDHLIRTAIELGAPVRDAYRTASWSAAQAFGLRDRGLIAPGKRADIVLVSDLETCSVRHVIAAGQPVMPESFQRDAGPAPVGMQSVRLDKVDAPAMSTPADGPTGSVIGIVPGRIITEHLTATLPFRDGCRHADTGQDLLKICVFERHGRNGNVGRGFVRGFGLSGGALASSVGHDSHNICVVGADDGDMAVAVNRLIDLGGGFAAVRDGQVVADLPLPIAGLMSDRPFEEVEAALRRLRDAVRDMGCALSEPFLQLAFLPLPVIPHLKITDMGLFDVDRFELI